MSLIFSLKIGEKRRFPNPNPNPNPNLSISLSAMAISGPSKAEILNLFRSLLRTARDFSDYNIREYAKRRTIHGFRQNHRLPDPSSAFSDGKSQLEIAKRQVVLYSLYAPRVKSVMEISQSMKP
ncbi:LYR family of Fe/S cluster biogenesis protein [Tasmannia lanceolata]|uniref:LYR family of Fe/S cluster biogenesis protein n=1 Tax=Tasmannia lanceolata TaxID=3420 RepID=UPI0040634065